MQVTNRQHVYLSHYLTQIAPYLNRPDVTDVYINQPREIWLETSQGLIERHQIEALDAPTIERFSRQVAALSNQGINREHPLLSATLPDGSRLQIIAPPATRKHYAVAIRKHQALHLTLADYARSLAFDEIKDRQAMSVDEDPIIRLRGKRDYPALLRHAIATKKNILVSGGTSTGKTTFLNMLLSEIAGTERLILIEDAAEIALSHDNSLGLIAARSALGEAVVTAEDLLNASLRMRPDRIVLGELRGPEAFTFLRAINTGHPGSMTTIHADNPAMAIQQLALLVLQTGSQLRHDDIVRYILSTVDLVVQLERVAGRRFISEIALRQDLC